MKRNNLQIPQFIYISLLVIIVLVLMGLALLPERF